MSQEANLIYINPIIHKIVAYGIWIQILVLLTLDQDIKHENTDILNRIKIELIKNKRDLFKGKPLPQITIGQPLTQEEC